MIDKTMKINEIKNFYYLFVMCGGGCITSEYFKNLPPPFGSLLVILTILTY